ncbi:MAG: hypothetical protein N3A38_08195, partial [Planctomycetota bacterium]|nr:hypothetical protein [Planctomycetota bacterium]
MGIERDRELQEYRDLIRPPAEFHDGFSWRTVVGAVFLGFVAMPAAMYIGLVSGAGGSVHGAARWVTVILFMEVAKRSLVHLRQQEIFVLYYMAGMVMASPFEGLLWRQFVVTSIAAGDFNLIGKFPSWYAPLPEEIAEGGRSFFTACWVAPIALIVLGQIIGRIDHFGLSYFLYRLTSDAEKLPFPMAPMAFFALSSSDAVLSLSSFFFASKSAWSDFRCCSSAWTL